jgi:hypothetical protein
MMSLLNRMRGRSEVLGGYRPKASKIHGVKRESNGYSNRLYRAVSIEQSMAKFPKKRHLS